jgi:hypothetical protein
MSEHVERDDKLQEFVCRLVMFFMFYIIAWIFCDGFTFIEGMIVWLFTGSHYDTTMILNNQRKDNRNATR